MANMAVLEAGRSRAAHRGLKADGVPGESKNMLTQGIPIVFKVGNTRLLRVQNLSYSVKTSRPKGGTTSILKNISGCFSAGEMSALMGASGSGKTTLLDAISGRKNHGSLEGDIRFSAQKPTTTFLRRYTGYVEQFDTLIGVLTVREMLLYTAEMKRPVEEPLAEKGRAVDDCIEALGLEACKDTRIGNALARGISGGQAKRANIGLAMVANPRVLFLDEPTTGLDSYTANEVIAAVRALAAAGVTVCATIHAPTPFCFRLFDRLLVLARGEVAYHGPNGSEMLAYFNSGCGVTPPATLMARNAANITNTADFLTDIVVGAEREGRSAEYVQAYRASALRARMADIADRASRADSLQLSKDEMAMMATTRATVTPLWKGFATLVRYRTAANHRNVDFLMQRFSDKIIFSTLMATLYLGIGSDLVEKNYINIAAVLFMWSVMPAFTATSFIPELMLERPLYVRERNDGLYRPITYLLAKLFDELFGLIVSSVVFSAFVFYVVDLQGSFLLFWLIYLVTLSIGLELGYLVAALSSTMDIANAALPTYVVTLLFFGGFIFRFEDMPAYWKWYSHINFLRYSWGAQMINAFDGVTADDGSQPTIGGEPVLEYFGLAERSAWGYLGYECIFLVVLFFAAWAVLQFKDFAKR